MARGLRVLPDHKSKNLHTFFIKKDGLAEPHDMMIGVFAEIVEPVVMTRLTHRDLCKEGWFHGAAYVGFGK